MKSKLLPLTLAILILLGGLTVYYNNPTTFAYAADKENTHVAIAEMIINRVSARIDFILSLADKYNIQIPDNLTDNVDIAKETLINATEVVNDNPCMAIKLAIKASVVFSPVARYVYKNLPDEAKTEIEHARKEAEITARLKMVERLRFLVEKLENMSVTVPDRVINDLDRAETLLNSSLDMVRSGSYDIHEVNSNIQKANQYIVDAIKTLHGEFKIIWRRASFADISMHLLGRLAFGLEKHINITIDQIERNETEEALDHIIGMMHIVNATLRRIDKLEPVINELPDEYAQAVNEIKTTLKDVYSFLDQAYDALSNGDSVSTITYLESAISEINSTLEDLQGLFKDAITYVRHLKGFVSAVNMRFKGWIKHMAMKKIADLTIRIGKLEFYLHKAYHRYQEGKISADQLRTILDHSKTVLNNVLDVLNGLDHPPRMLIHRIQGIIDWINQVESTLPS